MRLALVIADANKKNAVIGAHLLRSALSTKDAQTHDVLSGVEVFVASKPMLPVRAPDIAAAGWITAKKFKPIKSIVPVVIDAWGWGQVVVPKKCESPIPPLCLPCAVSQMSRMHRSTGSVAEIIELFRQAAEVCQRECADSEDQGVKRVCRDAIQVADVCAQFVLQINS